MKIIESVGIQSLLSSWKKILLCFQLGAAALSDRAKISDTTDIAIIVFSKDRPVQLEAMLRSAKKFFSGNCTWFILWRASSKQYTDAYTSLFSGKENCNINFVQETDFKTDLLGILKNSRHHGLIFMVDDILFVNHFDACAYIGLDPLFEIASLRHWPGISYCQPQMLYSPPPGLKISHKIPWLQFSWRESVGDWSMPVSMDGHLFSRTEILRLFKYVNFKAPNSFEKNLGDFRFLFKYRRGLCMSSPVIRNFAFNRVQSENEDFPCGSWNSDRMLEKWLTGWHLDIEALADLDAHSCHVEVEPVFERR
jgi:hypothetical protein